MLGSWHNAGIIGRILGINGVCHEIYTLAATCSAIAAPPSTYSGSSGMNDQCSSSSESDGDVHQDIVQRTSHRFAPQLTSQLQAGSHHAIKEEKD